MPLSVCCGALMVLTLTLFRGKRRKKMQYSRHYHCCYGIKAAYSDALLLASKEIWRELHVRGCEVADYTARNECQTQNRPVIRTCPYRTCQASRGSELLCTVKHHLLRWNWLCIIHNGLICILLRTLCVFFSFHAVHHSALPSLFWRFTVYSFELLMFVWLH